jgi:hypothetical protein
MQTHRFLSLDRTNVDRLYDLEPVFEPGEHASLEAWTELLCPYCGESSSASVDLTDPSRSYIEDCQVCCQPMQVTIRVDDAGRLRAISTRRLDD